MAVSSWATPAAQPSAIRAVGGKTPLAVVAGVPITVREFQREMLRRGGREGSYASVEARRELLEEMIRQRAVVVTAEREGYAEHPEVLAVAEQAMVATFTRDYLDVLLDDATVDEEAIEGYYQAHLEDYTEPEQVRVALILIEVPPDAGTEEVLKLQQLAESIREQALESESQRFADLARRHSGDRASRYLGGNIGWIQRTQRSLRWGDEVVDAAFSLRWPEEVGPVVRGARGFYVIQLKERAEARLRPLDALHAGIEHQLVREQRERLREQFYRQLEGALELEVYDEVLEALKPSTGGPPPVPGQ